MIVVKKINLIALFIFIFYAILSLYKFANAGIVLEVVQDQIIKKQNIDYSNGDYIKIGDVVVKVISDGNNETLKNILKNKNNNNKPQHTGVNNNLSNNLKKQNSNTIHQNVKKSVNLGEQERNRIQQMIVEQQKKNEEFIKKVNINKIEEEKD